MEGLNSDWINYLINIRYDWYCLIVREIGIVNSCLRSADISTCRSRPVCVALARVIIYDYEYFTQDCVVRGYRRRIDPWDIIKNIQVFFFPNELL